MRRDNEPLTAAEVREQGLTLVSIPALVDLTAIKFQDWVTATRAGMIRSATNRDLVAEDVTTYLTTLRNRRLVEAHQYMRRAEAEKQKADGYSELGRRFQEYLDALESAE